MVTHPGMDRLQALDEGELTGEQRRTTADHVAACERCREAVEWIADVRRTAREEVPPPSDRAWEMIAARVAAQDAVLLPVEPVPAPARVRSAAPLVRAAMLILLLAAGAAAAMPGGWLRSAVESIVPGLGRTDEGVTGDGQEAAVTPAPLPPVVLYVAPAAGALHVTLERPHHAVRIHVQLIDAPELEVRALDGAAGATFRTSPGRLDIVGAEAGAVMLGVPVSLGRVRIDVDGRTLLLKERGQIRILAPGVDTVGSEYILPVGAPTGPRQGS
jgi:hypothetical protein